MRQWMLILSIAVLVSCNATDLSPQERFDSLQDKAGSLGTTYDVFTSGEYVDDAEMRVAWYQDTRKSIIDGGLYTDGYTVLTTSGNTTTICEREYVRDDQSVYVCSEADNILRGRTAYPKLIEVAQDLNESSLTYVGDDDVVGRTCHRFKGVLNLTENIFAREEQGGRSQVCLDESTGRPLRIALKRQTKDPFANDTTWSTTVTMNASKTRNVVEDDAQAPVPFTVERSYTSSGDEEAHAVISSLVSFDESVDAGIRSDGAVNITMEANQTRHVVLPVDDVPESFDGPFADVARKDVPVCVGSDCHRSGERDPCIRKSSDKAACEEASRCVYDEDVGVCASKPASCEELDRWICEGTETKGGEACTWNGYSCERDQKQYNVSAETPKIAYWCGKVNQHREDGEWVTDPDGVSGCDMDKLDYCQKFYPDADIMVFDGRERITGWKNPGNTGSFTATKKTYRCK